MDWPEIIIEGFPGPRDGEPPDLRRDIADELNDHLACAMQRELRRTDDPAVAENAVLDRFGNPKRIARQLWWDAMKEQIMKDRIMIGMMILTLVICAVVGFFAWQMVQQGQQVNRAILARLAELNVPAKSAAQPEIATDLARVTFRCYDRLDQQGKTERHAADMVSISLTGHAFNDAQQDTITQNTDNQGVTTFGPVRPGKYTWSISPTGYEAQSGSVALYPGTIGEQVIDIPARQELATITIQANWPADLKQRDIVLYALFEPEDIQLGDHSWSARAQGVIISPEGTLRTDYWVSKTLWPAPSGTVDLAAGMGGYGGAVGTRADGYGGYDGLVAAAAPSPFVSRVYRQPMQRSGLFGYDDSLMGSAYKQKATEMPPARYRLEYLAVMCRASDPTDPNLRRIDCARVDYAEVTQPPMFDAQYGKDNTWTINLPEELVKQARENLPRCQEPLDMLTDIELRVAWPKDLAKRSFPLLCKFVPATAPPENVFQNQWWSVNEWMPFIRADGYLVWGYEYAAVPPKPSRVAGAPESNLNVIIPEGVELKEDPRIRRPATTYWLTAISVLSPTENAMNPQIKWHRIAEQEFHDSSEKPTFVAERGKFNRWTITLSEDLLKQVREYLVAETQPASEPADVASPRAGRM